MARRRRGKRWKSRWRWLAIVLLLFPATYLLAALIGSLTPVNAKWKEPAGGPTIYLADNGVHTDIIMPVLAQGLDWTRFINPKDVAQIDPNASFIAFGAGAEGVYLDTPTWWDLRPRTALSALVGDRQVMHVQYVPSPSYAIREIRLRPDEYRRLWAAVRASFELDARGRPKKIRHPGYGPSDAFYRGTGKANAIHTCNSWVADRLRLAGVKTSLWAPFGKGLLWRYRQQNWLALF